MPTVFVSDAIGDERLAYSAAAPSGIPLRHHWKQLAARYRDSLAACGLPVRGLLRPEIYQTAAARSVLGAAPRDWHLAVKPIEHLRPFHGLPNVWVCDWPFPELSRRILGGSPFFNQRRMLSLANAVLCPTAATAATLQAAGVAHTLVLPPALPSVPRRASPPRTGKRTQFLCVADADALPRQLGPALAGFALAAARDPGLHLTLGLRGATAAQAATIGAANPGVAVTLHETAAWAEADFLLAANAAAGLDLPVAEAMTIGLPILATAAAGSGAGLPPEACVPIPAAPELLDGSGEPIGRFMPLTSYPPTAEAVRDAVLSAAALSQAERSRMADAARTAAARFTPAAFAGGLAQLLAMLEAR